MTVKASIDINNEKIDIKEIKMADVPELLRALQPFVDEFDRIVSANKDLPPKDLLSLVANNAEHACWLASAVTDKPVAYYKAMPPLDFFNVMQQVVELYAEFFLTHILEPLSKLGAYIMQAAVEHNEKNN